MRPWFHDHERNEPYPRPRGRRRTRTQSAAVGKLSAATLSSKRVSTANTRQTRGCELVLSVTHRWCEFSDL